MEESQGSTGPDPEGNGEWKEQGRKDKRKKRAIQIDAKVRKSETNEQQDSSTVQEKICARGKRAIDYTKVIETSLCAEWNLNADT
eukprot:8517416-Ditylum_brightwellii.AAC.1